MSGSRTTIAFALRGLTCLLAALGAAPTGAAEPKVPSDLDQSAAVLQDRNQQQLFAQAQADLRDGHLAPALLALQQLLDSPPSYLPIDGSRFVNLQGEANRQIGALAPDDLELYEAQSGDEAARQLAQARTENQVALLREIATRYRHTRAGLAALQELAAREFDAGRCSSAALGWTTVLEHPRATGAMRQPVITALLTAWDRAGERELIQRFVETHRHEITPYTRLPQERIRPTAPRLQPSDQEVFGRPAHLVPASQTLWTHDTALKPPLTALLRTFVDQQQRQGRVLVFPSLPIVIGETAVVRGPAALECLNLTSGEQRWRRPFPSLAGRLTDNPDRLLNSGFERLMGESLAEELFDETQSTVLETDGERVYLLQPPEPTQEGSLGETFAPSPTRNVLVAVQLADGTDAWSIGEQSDPSRRICEMVLGAPTLHEGVLYILGQTGTAVSLYALAPRDGRMMWSLPLAETELTLEDDPERWGRGCRVVAHRGLLLCPTGSGLLAAVNPFDRALVWAWQYRRDHVSPTLQARTWKDNRASPERWWERWSDLSLIAINDRLLLASPETDHLSALDLTTGRVLWQRPQVDGLFLAAAHRDSVLIAEAHGLRVRDLETGDDRWFAAVGTPTGRGLSGPQQYIAPVSGGMASINWTDGAVRRTYFLNRAALGNLLPLPKGILSQSESAVTMHPTMIEELTAAVDAARPQPSAAAIVQQARLTLEMGRLAPDESFMIP